MARAIFLFAGPSGVNSRIGLFDVYGTSLWVTDGTPAGTTELQVAGASPSGLDPQNFAIFGDKILFAGVDAQGLVGLWESDATSAGTTELQVVAPGSYSYPSALTVLGDKVLFTEADTHGALGLWVTDGTSAGTTQLQVAGAGNNFNPSNFTVLGDKVLFAGQDAQGQIGLWVTDGTASGTTELQIAGVSHSLGPQDFKVLGNKVLFAGLDSQGHTGLWVTDGTSAGTAELQIAGADPGGINPRELTAFGNKILFEGQDAQGQSDLWVTDGTSAGTTEFQTRVNNASGPGLPDYTYSHNDLAVLGDKVLFLAADSAGYYGPPGGSSLWVTDGTAAGTTELLYKNGASDLTVLGDKVLVAGLDAQGQTGLWVTDGTPSGTTELKITGASQQYGISPGNFQAVGNEATFTGLDTNGSQDFIVKDPLLSLAPGSHSLWITDGTASGTTELLSGAREFNFPGIALPPSINSNIACFAAGTLIETSHGAVPVERLREGDAVLTVSGQHQPIQWIGRRTIDCRRHIEPERVQPIRVAPHAFGENKPSRALMLSPDHSVFVEDVLIPIKFLINETTVNQVSVRKVTYFHIELPRHDVVMAEGLPAESYLETGGRGAFENSDGAMQLHADFKPDEAQVAMIWQNFGYAPLMGTDGQYYRVVARLAAQSLMLDNSTIPRRRHRRIRQK